MYIAIIFDAGDGSAAAGWFRRRRDAVGAAARRLMVAGGDAVIYRPGRDRVVRLRRAYGPGVGYYVARAIFREGA